MKKIQKSKIKLKIATFWRWQYKAELTVVFDTIYFKSESGYASANDMASELVNSFNNQSCTKLFLVLSVKIQKV